MASITTSSPILPRLSPPPRPRRQTRSKSSPEDSCSSTKPSQNAIAAYLVGFIFFLYAVGFSLTVLSLPEVNNHLLLSRKQGGSGSNHKMLNLSKYSNVKIHKATANNKNKDSRWDERELLKLESEKEDVKIHKATHDNKGPRSEHLEREKEVRKMKSHHGSEDFSVDADDDDDEIFKKFEEGDDAKHDDDNKYLDDDTEQQRKEEVPALIKKTPIEKTVTLPATSTVPKSIWPVTTRNEDGKWEDIAHPGDSSITMTVPPFWSLPLHDQTLIPKAKAMRIGTCITPDDTGNFQKGDTCKPHERTLFVAIASYRDWQCRFTLESIFSRAKYPERVRVGVVDQIAEGDDECDVPIKSCEEEPEQALCKHKDRVDALQIDAELSVGPVFARHLGHRLYRGEYYAMQSDAHVSFTQDWDVDIIDQLESTNDDMAVLTSYLTDIEGSIDETTGKSLRQTRPIMCNTAYESNAQGVYLRHLSQPESKAAIVGMPQLEPYWAAGFSFSRGHFVVNVPYDLYQPMIFQGEEMSIAVRGFTIGYDFFSPERSVCFHHYKEGKNKAGRGKVNHFWENAPKYAGVGVVAMERLLGIVHMNPEINPKEWLHSEEDRYGIGNVRTTEKFYTIFGVDIQGKTTLPGLCNFVKPGIMHENFMKHLRPDGMGIDYEAITQPFSSYL